MPSEFAPDCGRCAALCCLALAFDAGDDFAFDKPAGLPCPKLAGHACTIHARLDRAGFAGCAAYSCHGAGQIVTQDLFGGQSWRQRPDLAQPMMAAFARLREVQDLRAQLAAAWGLDLPAGRRAEVEALEVRLTPPEGWTAAAVESLDLGAVRAAFRVLVAGLRADLPGAAA